MEVKMGYKQTEVGVIPEDWEVRKLGEVIKILGGGAFKSSDRTNSGIRWLKISNVGINQIIWKEEDFLPLHLIAENKSLLLQNGDYVMALTRPILDRRLKIAKLSSIDTPALLNQRVGKIEVLGSNEIDYVYYFFQKYEVINSLLQSMAGTDPPNLSNKAIYCINCPVPSTLAEQIAIANALSDADALIQSLQKLIAKKRAIKQGAMQELLKPKEGWVEKWLGEVATLKARIGWQGLTTAEYRDTGDYFLITGTDFKNGVIDWGNCYFVDSSRYKQDRNIQVKEEDVLVTKDGTIGKVAFVKRVPKPATLNSGVFVIRPIGESFHPEFLNYVLLSKTFKTFLNQLSAGSTINHLYQKDFVHFNFYTPVEIEEQTRIAAILSDMDAEITALEAKLAKYKQIKQGMMQNLLTGRIRLV